MGGTAFIVGGTGQIGTAAATALADAGWAVTAASRRGDVPDALAERGVRGAALDREEPGALARALDRKGGGGADLLLDVVAYDEGHAAQLLEVQGSVGRLVAVSSAAVYRDARGRTLDQSAPGGFPDYGAPVREDQDTVEPGPATYATRKVALERALLDGARVPAALLRPCAIHGWPTRHPREWWFAKRLLDGRATIPLLRGGADVFQTTAAAAIGRLVALLGERRFTGPLNVTDADAPSVAEIGRAVMAAVGREAELVPAPPGAPPGVGATPWSVPHPIRLDAAAARALAAADPPPYAEAVRDTVGHLLAFRGDWEAAFPLLAAYPYSQFDYAAEDAALAGR